MKGKRVHLTKVLLGKQVVVQVVTRGDGPKRVELQLGDDWDHFDVTQLGELIRLLSEARGWLMEDV